MDTFEAWRQADDRWVEDHHDLVRVTFEQFMERGAWPQIFRLQRILDQASVSPIDVRRAATEKPPVPGEHPPGVLTAVTLGCRHLLGLPQARPLLDLAVAATRQAVDAYLSTEADDPLVRSTDPVVRSAAGALTIAHFSEFILADPPSPFARGEEGDDWALAVNEPLVMAFEGVESPEEYVERQLQIIAESIDRKNDRRATSSGPAVAFVVMPFREPWCEDVYDFILRSVARLKGALTTVRADRISRFGRITDQVVEALRRSDLVIADITGNNPNVAWQLGYAHAQGKPCAVLLRRGSSDMPFVIYSERRYEYTPAPSVRDEIRVAERLKGALGVSFANSPRHRG